MTIARILAATDFSAPARRAVQRAAYVAKLTDGELVLVHALPEAGVMERLFHRGDITHAQMRAGAERMLQTICEDVERTNGVKASWRIAVGSARRIVAEMASSLGASLLVVGARGENESSYHKPTLGGTATKLVAAATTPLLLVRRPGEPAYRKVMIAVAGGETARRVLAGARQLAESAECHVLHSFDAPFAARLESVGVSAAAIDAYAFEQRDAEQKALDRLIAEAGFDGKLRPRVVRGDAVASAFREIEALDPDLVVVGKHDERARGDSSSELGSVALRLTFGASCDVLQIP